MVDEQLNQLYLEMELEGLSAKLSLEDATTSSSSYSSDDNIKKYKVSQYTTAQGWPNF